MSTGRYGICQAYATIYIAAAATNLSAAWLQDMEVVKQRNGACAWIRLETLKCCRSCIRHDRVLGIADVPGAQQKAAATKAYR